MPDFGKVDDSTLLTAWRSGDSSASGELVRRHYRSIYLFFFSKVGPDLAQDLTQTVFERILEKPNNFRAQASVRTYLFGIARWTLVHHHRKHRAQTEAFDPALDPLEIPEDVISMTSQLAARREEVLFVHGMRALALDDQLVLELKYYDDLTVRELAEVFGTARATMADRLARARSRLAEAVGRLEGSAKLVESTMAGLDEHMKAVRAQFAGRVKSR